ncbi:hypothetical protein [Synechococcus sp. MIT S9508]|uniref:hypothetical protein n=1 Tax=Synechococcus sp. MIT S9508 TaxID=1801629 RepID=UPI0007BB0B80|nr:hypothetical protein [Synechococcus sp. MIT S9508]KZR88444.1 hypothetical protein MITS9508_02269 [Synechococcus sp. MIT S9508]
MTELFNRPSASRDSEVLIHLSEWLEKICMQMLLTLALWPLKLMYKRPRPEESWPAWQANQKLCRADQRYC